jgi:hypothetical protein
VLVLSYTGKNLYREHCQQFTIIYKYFKVALNKTIYVLGKESMPKFTSTYRHDEYNLDLTFSQRSM